MTEHETDPTLEPPVVEAVTSTEGLVDKLVVLGAASIEEGHREYANGVTWVQRFQDGSMSFLLEREGMPDERLHIIKGLSDAKRTLYEMTVSPDRNVLAIDVKTSNGKEAMAFRQRTGDPENPRLRPFLGVLLEGFRD